MRKNMCCMEFSCSSFLTTTIYVPLYLIGTKYASCCVGDVRNHCLPYLVDDILCVMGWVMAVNISHIQDCTLSQHSGLSILSHEFCRSFFDFITWYNVPL